MILDHMEKSDETNEQFTPFTELCKFADYYGFIVEIEKPFVEMDQLFLKVLDSEGTEVYRVTLDDITSVNTEAASVLNDLAKEN